MIKPLGNRCLVQLDRQAQETGTGIQLISEDQYQKQIGTVLSVGDPGPVRAGQRILFEQFAGIPIDTGSDDPTVIVEYQDIVAILLEDDDSVF